MRRGKRTQPYLPTELFQKLRDYAAARSETVTAVIIAAVREYLERDEVEDALLVRHLDGVTQGIGQLQRDLETLAAGFGRFVRYSFFGAPTEVPPEVFRRAEKLYSEFLERVSEQLRDGVKFTGQVWRAHGRLAAPPFTGGAGAGGREGEKQP